jgi:amino acid transporter
MTLFPLIFLIFFEVAGGPYGAEPVVQAGGPLLALIGFFVFPFVWAVPESLVTAELSSAMPGNGGYVVWVDRAFGPFAGSLMGTWKYVCSAMPSAFLVLVVMAVAGWKVFVASTAFTGAGVVVYRVIAFCKGRGCFKFSRAEGQE